MRPASPLGLVGQRPLKLTVPQYYFSSLEGDTIDSEIDLDLNTLTETICRNVEDGDDDKTLHCLSLGSI